MKCCSKDIFHFSVVIMLTVLDFHIVFYALCNIYMLYASIQSGFYPGTFVYSRFFSKIEFLYCLLTQYFEGHWGWEFWNLGLQIPGKCMSYTLYIFKGHTVATIDIIFPCDYYGLVKKSTKSHHSNRWIRLGNKPPRLPCRWVILFFCNQTWQGQSLMLSLVIFFFSKHCSISVIYS